jgi:type II secretion system protein C
MVINKHNIKLKFESILQNSNEVLFSSKFSNVLAILIFLLVAVEVINTGWYFLLNSKDVSMESRDTSLFIQKINYPSLISDPFERSSNLALSLALQVETPPQTALPIKLYGIVYSDLGTIDSAILGFNTNEQKNYKINESVADNIILESISPELVIISREGIRESVMFNQDRVLDLPKIDPVLVQNSKNSTTATLDSISSLSKLVTFKPYFLNGSLKGYQLYRGNKSALFQQRGLKEGDILVTVNGLNVQDPAFIKELVGPGSVKLDLLRDKQRYSMTLDLN